MKRLMVAVAAIFFAVLFMATGAMAADVQKAYLTGSVNASEFDNINKYNIEARVKVGLHKGFGVDASAFYDVGSRADAITMRTGVFFQPTSWSEVSYSTEWGVDNIANFGDGRVVRFSIGKDF